MCEATAPQIEEKDRSRRELRFGDLIADVYAACGHASATGILRLAVNAHLVAFAGREHFVIIEEHHEDSPI